MALHPAVKQDRIPAGVYTRDDLAGDSVIDCDVVIVGSGAGGGAEGGADPGIPERRKPRPDLLGRLLPEAD